MLFRKRLSLHRIRRMPHAEEELGDNQRSAEGWTWKVYVPNLLMKRIHSSQSTWNAWDIRRWQWMTFDILRNCLRLSLRSCNFSAVLCPAQQSGMEMQLYCMSQPMGVWFDSLLQQTIAYVCPVERRHVNVFARKCSNMWNCADFIYDPVANSPSVCPSFLIQNSSHRWN